MYRRLVKLALFGATASALVLAGLWLFGPASPLAVIAAFLCIGAALVAFMILKPPLIKGQEKAGRLALTYSEQPLAVLVWRPVAAVAFGDNPCSAAWLSALVKEIGPAAAVENWSDLPYDCPIIVVSSSYSLTQAELADMNRRAERGAQIVLETPSGASVEWAGLGEAGEAIRVNQLHLNENRIDLWGSIQLVGYEAGQARIVWTQDGCGVLYHREIGRGGVWTLALAYANWAAGITLGRPRSDNYLTPKGLDWSIQNLQTHDLQQTPEQKRKFEPVVDVFDRELFDLVREQGGVPRLWPHPKGQAAALSLTFDEDYYGAGCCRLDPPPIPGSWFITSPTKLDPASADALRREGASLGLHWNRFLVHLTKLGLHFNRLGLSDQRRSLVASLGQVEPVNRTHYLIWDKRWNRDFETMAGAGISLDTSFGPGRGEHGYTFGSAFPYLPFDRSGRAIGVWEAPFQIHEPMGRPTAEENRRLIDQALSDYHGFIIALFHPYYCLPCAVSHDRYQDLLNRCTESGKLYFPTIAELAADWRARMSCRLSFRRDNSVMIIRCRAERPVCLRLPKKMAAARLIVNGAERSPASLIALAEGDNEVKVEFASF